MFDVVILTRRMKTGSRGGQGKQLVDLRDGVEKYILHWEVGDKQTAVWNGSW
jgi:hypothetical protein